MLAFGGCTPVSAGFIAVTDGVYTLTIPERCGRKIVSVSVAYYSATEPSPDLWVASAEVEVASNHVVLFQPNDGYVTEGDASGIDFSKELTIGWGEGATDSPGGVTGVLGTLGPDDVLWTNGITTAGELDRQISSAVPGSYRC